MANDERLLGRIEATVDSIAETQAAYRLEQQRSNELISRKLDGQTRTMSGLESAFNLHVSDDKRQFTLIWKIILGAGSGGALVAGVAKLVGG